MYQSLSLNIRHKIKTEKNLKKRFYKSKSIGSGEVPLLKLT